MISVAWPARVAADERPAWDMSGGYSLAIDNDIAGEGALPIGWFGSVDVAISRFVALVGDVSGNHTTVVMIVPRGTQSHLRLYTYTAGARLFARQATSTPFADVLVGMARVGADADGLPWARVRDNRFVIQPGGGIDIAVTRRLRVRAGGRVRIIPGHFGTSKHLQTFAGLVLD